VPVHDLKIHPRDREIIAATHGRSLWITDIAPLEQMSDSTMRQGSYFFQPTQAYEYALAQTQSWNGNKIYVADNPPYGATFTYRLTGGDARRDTTRIVVTDVKGDVIRRLTGPAGAGVHRVTWDLRGLSKPLGPTGIRDSIIAARTRRQREDSVARNTTSDTTGAGRGIPGMDTTAMKTMRDSMGAMRARGDTAGLRALRDRMQAQGGGGRRGGGRGGAGGGFGGPGGGGINLRPAEAPLGAAGAFGGGGGGGGRGGRFGGARPGAPIAEGDYLVTITVNGVSMKRVVHVERIGDVPEDNGFGGDDEDGGGDP
jgi:hypothetical protein